MREKKKNQEKGVTIIALVITVIVLLILAGISIASLTGDNGIINKSTEAKKETEISQYQEKLDIIKHQEYMNDYEMNLDEFLDKYAEAVKKDEMFVEAKEVTADHTNKIVIVVTKEGYRFEVTADEVTYVGDEGDGSGNVEIDKVKVSIMTDPENWTNGRVKVKITSNVTGITKEYSIDEGVSWNIYENEIEVERNGTTIQARGKNAKGEITGVVTKRIENIDRLSPKEFTPTVKSGKNKITITSSTTDKEATNVDGKSGIKGYKFSKDNGGSWTELKTVGTYTYEGLKGGTEYPIKVKAIDNAGNEIDSNVVNGVPEEEITVPDAEGKITFQKNPSNWTKGPVKVQMTTNEADCKIQYSYDNSSFTNYINEIDITENKTIYARLEKGGKTGKSTTYKIDNIDKLPPKDFEGRITNKTSNSITVEGATTDTEATQTDGNSGIRGYKFSKDNGTSWTEEQKEGRYTFGRLASSTQYNILIKAIDNAGNEKTSKVVQGTTEEIPSGVINFSYEPSEWTNKDVTVTISADISDYTLQYSLNGTQWNNYNKTSKVVMKDNGPVYARLTDGTKFSTTATGNVNNIDRTAPTGSGTVSIESKDAGEATIKITATDRESGIASITNKTTEFITKENDTTYKVTKNGSYSFQIIDKANNITNIVVKVDIVLPSTEDTKPFLPDGSEIIEDDLEKGVVIKDSNGNEWTWIEVPKSIYTNGMYNGGTAPTSSTDYAKIESTMQNYAGDYREDGYKDSWWSRYEHGFVSKEEYNNHKNTMLKSVYENGGFYIGRYEAGTKTLRVSSSSKLTTPVIQEGAYPYNHITNAEAQRKSKELATGGRTSSLMFGIQWDLVLKHIENKKGKKYGELKNDSTNWGNYYNATFEITKGKYSTDDGDTFTEVNGTYTKPVGEVLLTTGTTERNSVLNIYDLAGNEAEWTLENSVGLGNPSVFRGGYSLDRGSTSTASYHDNCKTPYSEYYISFRPVLW